MFLMMMKLLPISSFSLFLECYFDVNYIHKNNSHSTRETENTKTTRETFKTKRGKKSERAFPLLISFSKQAEVARLMAEMRLMGVDKDKKKKRKNKKK
jgi:hypothetical protein